MGQNHGSYTRFISITKTLLALAAIGLLGTVFLFTKEQNLEGGLRFSTAELEELETGMQILGPNFSGRNVAGDVYSFSADKILPNATIPTQVIVTGLSGDIRYSAGGTAYLSADRGEYFSKREVLDLRGNITVATLDGTVATSEVMVADLKTGQVSSDVAVNAHGPLGEISAGSFRIITVEEDGEEKQMIWFENGVMLKFKPSSWEDQE